MPRHAGVIGADSAVRGQPQPVAGIASADAMTRCLTCSTPELPLPASIARTLFKSWRIAQTLLCELPPYVSSRGPAPRCEGRPSGGSLVLRVLQDERRLQIGRHPLLLENVSVRTGSWP